MLFFSTKATACGFPSSKDLNATKNTGIRAKNQLLDVDNSSHSFFKNVAQKGHISDLLDVKRNRCHDLLLIRLGRMKAYIR